MTEAMAPCPVGKKGRHELMAFFHTEDFDVPATLACSTCGMTKQFPLKWTSEGSLDERTAEAIREAVNGTSQ